MITMMCYKLATIPNLSPERGDEQVVCLTHVVVEHVTDAPVVVAPVVFAPVAAAPVVVAPMAAAPVVVARPSSNDDDDEDDLYD